jgi:hypothetical protein
MRLREDHEAAKEALVALDNCQEVPSVENAIELLAHASSCQECGAFVAERPGCAEALIESTHPDAELTASTEEMIAKTQNEFLVFGDAVLERLTRVKFQGVEKYLEQLAIELPLERRTDLWTLREIETPRLRCALASAESVRSIRSFLTGGRRKPLVAILLLDLEAKDPTQWASLQLNKDRVIPGGYFAGRIATYALVSKESPYMTQQNLASGLWILAAMMWRAVAETAIFGGVGLPELFWTQVSKTEIALSLSADADRESKLTRGMPA